MSKNKLKIMLSFMRELNDGKIPNAADYELTNDEYGDIIEMCQNEGLIKGATIQRGGQQNRVLVLFLGQTKLTVKGLEYLDEHSAAMQTYRGLMFLKEWLPW